MLKINLQEELTKYQKERKDLIDAMNQAQNNLDNIKTQVIRREGIIAYLINAIQEETKEKAKKTPKKPNIKQQKAELMARAKREVKNAEAKTGNKS